MLAGRRYALHQANRLPSKQEANTAANARAGAFEVSPSDASHDV
jgi:hypothetical protein